MGTRDKVQESIEEILYGDHTALVGAIKEDTNVQLQASYNIEVEDLIELSHEHYSKVALIRQTHKGVTRRFRVFFNKKGNGIARVTYPTSIRERRDAWELIMRLIEATNNGSVEGQLACFADTVSPYYKHHTLSKQGVYHDLLQWQSRYSYYHMKELHTSVEASNNLLYDYDVNVKFQVTWKDVEGRYTHKQIFYALYSVSLREPHAKIVAAKVLRQINVR